MTRKISILFVLALFVVSLGSLAFAANAKTSSLLRDVSGQNAGKSMPYTDRIDDMSGDPSFSKPNMEEPISLGYYMLATTQVGNSYFDHQSNDTQQRQIVMGANNWIHNVWMYRPGGATGSGQRSVRYVGYRLGNAVGAYSTPSPLTGGYGTVSLHPVDSIAMVAFHYTKAGTGYDARARIQIGRQSSAGGGSFGMYDYPVSDSVMPLITNCQGIKTGQGDREADYIWPIIAGDNNGTSRIAHALTIESVGATTSTYYDSTMKRSLVYWKTLPEAAAPTSTCGTFLDSTSSNLTYTIVADPTSDRVAAVYLYPRHWQAYWNAGLWDNVVYRESQDLGANWGARTKITDYADSELWVQASSGVLVQMTPYEVSALYTDDHCLHVLWNTQWTTQNLYYNAGGTWPYQYYTSLYGWTRLYHWSSCNSTCIEMLTDQIGQPFDNTCTPPNGYYNIGKISLTQCTVGGTPRLYAVYSMFPDSIRVTGNTRADCSSAKFLNADIVVQGSTDATGEFWGAPVNISNTASNLCTGGNCFSEVFTNTAPYVNDSLRVQYMLDKDAGDFAVGPEGTETLNNIYNLSYVCYAISTEAILTVSPASIEYPFHTIPGGLSPIVVDTFTNSGNTFAAYTRSVVYTPSVTPWLTFTQPSTGSIPAGCTYTQIDNIQATGPATEGLYKATITYNYTGGKTLSIPVWLYNFNTANWFVENPNYAVTLRTASMRMNVAQTSRAGLQRGDYSLKLFSDPAGKSYLYDASLLLGTSNANMSMGVFSDSAGLSSHGDTAIGRLFCLSNMTWDTASGATGYRKASGVGVNRDSTIGIDAEFYAPKHVDSGNFMVGKFSMYAGPKNPAATINNVTVAYAADWDVPDDSSHNSAGYDETLQMVYQQGVWGTATSRFGAMAGWRDDNTAIEYGMVLDNPSYVYRLRGYVHDTIWTKIQTTADYTAFAGTPDDLNSMLVFSKSAQIKPKASGVFTVYVFFAVQPGTGGTLNGLKAELAKAKAFMCKYLNPNTALCTGGCTTCGDANSDGAIDISDAVFLISHIFTGGAAPGECNYPKGKGDANGDQTVDISDAVYLISRIFTGGPPPHCFGQ